MEEKIIQITSGRGPMECMWVTVKLLKELIIDAKKQKIETDVLQRNLSTKTELLESVTIKLSGIHLSEFISNWEGSVLWIGKSPYRKFHKRKNWFVEIVSFDMPPSVSLNLKDVELQATKSSGPGGQHVNKTMSAIRATHKPTGLSVLAQDSRSQNQNKQLALDRLEKLLIIDQDNTLRNLENEQWKKKIIVQRGNPIKIFEGSNFEPKKT